MYHFMYRNDLAKRTFKTYDFYKKLQDHMTPAGLAFFQSDYGANVKDFYHNVLEMKEPIFEYDFPQPYLPPEQYFPLRQAFNLYLDRYRDPKQVRRSFSSQSMENRCRLNNDTVNNDTFQFFIR